MPRPASPKADFIRSLPSGLPVAEIVQRAEKAGLTISDSMIRKTLAAKGPRRGPGRPPKASTAAGTRKAPPSAPSTKPSTTPSTGSREAERLLLDTALRVVGIERAIEILEKARGRIDRLLRDLIQRAPSRQWAER